MLRPSSSCSWPVGAAAFCSADEPRRRAPPDELPRFSCRVGAVLGSARERFTRFHRDWPLQLALISMRVEVRAKAVPPALVPRRRLKCLSAVSTLAGRPAAAAQHHTSSHTVPTRARPRRDGTGRQNEHYLHTCHTRGRKCDLKGCFSANGQPKDSVDTPRAPGSRTCTVVGVVAHRAGENSQGLFVS